MNDAARGAGSVAAAVAALRGARFFEGVPADILASLASEAEFIEIAAGETLFHEGDGSSDLYVLRSGAVAILRRQHDGSNLRVGDIFSGETVGEMAMLTGAARTATAIALRDSELVRLTREAVGRLVARDPEIALAIARVLAQRLAAANTATRGVARPRVFAILPHHALEARRVATFVRGLTGALRVFGAVAAIDGAHRESPRGVVQRAEAQNDYTLLIGDGGDPQWSAFCARQADLALLVADARMEPSTSPAWGAPHAPHSRHELQRELVLLGGQSPERRRAAGWRDAAQHDFLHHAESGADLPRVARLITRQATTLVLSGGGARGFAHLGVVDALMEAGLALDMFGGSSMGAIVAAAYAGGWPRETVHDRLRRAFVHGRPLSDPAFPVVALFRGRKVERLLEQAFGDRTIEDLPLPYFCVSSSLTRAAPAVHRAGLLRHWLRASIAIPGVLPPVVENGVVHVDGGVMDNLPIDAATALLRGPVIGVDASGEEEFRHVDPASPPLWQRLLGGRKAGDPTIMEILYRVGTVGSVSTAQRDEEAATLVLRPPVGRIGLLDWRSFDRCVAIGYDYARRMIAERPELFAGLRRAPGDSALAPEGRAAL
ncbi:MAG: hypothetical protein BGP06_16185 [Rhizobiales bacterium 65-9]|nr:MAG: hypothetical protein BGP06_16185 [Rhizobiales bacterium 65-9]